MPNPLPDLTLGFIPVARPTFDIPLANEVTDAARASLTHAGFRVVSAGDVLVMSVDEAAHAAQRLHGEPIDLLIVFQASFADSTMIMQIAETLDTPLLLWSIPEAPNGARLRLNSLCGINLGGHALTRAGYRYDTLYAAPDDPAALEKIETLARAGHAVRRLRGARIGRIGEHPDGFETCIPTPAALREQFGVELQQYDLETVFEKVRLAEPHAVSAAAAHLRERVSGLDDLDQNGVRGTLATYVTLHDLAQQEQIDGYAVRCWPQFFTEMGCAACGASSLLNDELTPSSCETDVNGTITQLMLQWVSGEPVFGSDIVSFDFDANTAVFWHCGKAPLSMADPQTPPGVTIHSNRKLPLLMEFALKPGRVTLARISEATGGYRLVVGAGEVVRAPISFSGTSGVVRFDRPADTVLNTILSEGLEHHLTLVYGDHVDALLALAKMLDLPVLHL